MSNLPRISLQWQRRQASVTIFIPHSFRDQRRKSNRRKDNQLLYGWAFSANEDESYGIIIIAGSISLTEAEQNRMHICDSLTDPEKVCILGEVLDGPNDGARLNAHAVVSDTQKTSLGVNGAEVWLEIKGSGSNFDKYNLISLRCPMKIDSMTCAISKITYRIPFPNQMQYISLEPMILPLASTAELIISVNGNANKSEEAAQQDRLERLVMLDPKRFADLNRNYTAGQAPGEGLRKAVDLINRVDYLCQAIRQKGRGRSNGNSEKRSSDYLRMVWQFPKGLIILIRPVLSKSPNPYLPSLVEISACARQLNLRLGQALVWPTLGHRLRSNRMREQQPVSHSGPQYTALYNGVWLVANDLILGQAAGMLLCENRHELASTLLTFIVPIFVTSVTEALHFLDNWPLGVKLNTPLSRFFCDMYTGMTEIWSEQILSKVAMNGAQVLSTMIYSIGMATRIFGFSMMLCILIDLFNLTTFHLSVFYHIQWRMYAFFCSSITSLFYLFRGKKRNPLRKMRVDHATYDLDQLLLGTIFFTILLFLWLTVATYYLLFSTIRLVNVTIIALLQTILAIVNHLPLFALMLRIKDPARLPGGVALRLKEGGQKKSRKNVEKVLPSTDFELQNVPLKLSDIFRGQHRHLENLLGLPRLLLHVLKGKRI